MSNFSEGPGWKLVLGDCLDLLRTLPDKSVDHVICDPPYEAEAHTSGRRGRRGGTFKETPLSFGAMGSELRAAVGAEFSRLARRWIVVFCQVEAVHLWRQAIGAGTYVRTMVWVKNTTTPQMTGDRPGMGWESMIVHHQAGKKRWNGGGRSGVWRGATVTKVGVPNEHETQKPVSLLEELTRNFTDPGETILDPFAGSGTTGVAAIRLGRRFVGCELSPKYHAVAIKRLSQAREQLGLWTGAA